MAEIQLKAFLKGETSTGKSPICIGILPCEEEQVPMGTTKGFWGFSILFISFFLAMLIAGCFGGASSGLVYPGINSSSGKILSIL